MGMERMFKTLSNMKSEPFTKQPLQLWLQVAFGGHYAISHCLVDHTSKLFHRFCNVVVLPIISLSPNEIDCNLQDYSQQNKGKTIIGTCLEAQDSDVPIWV